MNSITKKQKLKNLQTAMIEGEQSGDAGDLDIQAIKQKLRKVLCV